MRCVTLSREAGANVFMLSDHVGTLVGSGHLVLREGLEVAILFLREGFFSEAAILFYGKVSSPKRPFCF